LLKELKKLWSLNQFAQEKVCIMRKESLLKINWEIKLNIEFGTLIDLKL